jgi:hypothetical protein
VTNRQVALALLVLSAALYFGVARPWATAAINAADEYARLRRNRQQVRAQIEALERRVVRLRGNARSVSNTKAVDRPLTHVRRRILAALSSAPVSDVRLQIRTSPGAGAIKAHLSAQGRFIDLAHLAARVTHSETGLVLERVALAPAAPGAALELDVVWIGG